MTATDAAAAPIETGTEAAPAAAGGTLDPADRDWIKALAAGAGEMNRDRLHAAYMRFFLDGPAPEGGDDERDDDEDDVGADEEDDIDAMMENLRRNREEMERGDDDDDDEGAADWDEINRQAEEDDAAQDAELAQVDDDFINWITTHNERLDVAAPASAPPLGGDLVRQRLDAHGVASSAAGAARGDGQRGPERLAALDDNMSGLPTRMHINVDVLLEVAWIRTRLMEPGQPLAGLDLSRVSVVDDELQKALALLFDAGLEPGHIATYFRYAFPCLRQHLWYVWRPVGDDKVADPSLPYCAETGLRVHPLQQDCPDTDRAHPTYLHDGTAGFNDLLRRAKAQHARIVGKPCDLRLGRLLWHVAEQHQLCISFEKQRQDVLAKLRGIAQSASSQTEAGGADDRTAAGAAIRQLGGQPLKHAHEAINWRQYAEWLGGAAGNLAVAGAESRGAWADAVRRGQQSVLAEFAVDPQHVATVANKKMSVDVGAADLAASRMPPQYVTVRGDPLTWASAFVVADDDGAADILLRAERAYAEHLAAVPALREAAFEAMLAHGILVVTPRGGASRTAFPQRLSVQALAASQPFALLEILEAAANNLLSIQIGLPRGTIMSKCALDEWVQASALAHGTDADAWRDVLGRVAEAAASRLAAIADPQARRELQRRAETAHIGSVVTRLGHLCAEGPYEASQLALAAYQIRPRPLWEAQHEELEALPRHPDLPPLPVPLCGVYRGATGTTHFVIVDADGVPRQSIRWVDCVTDTVDGAQEQAKQESLLLEAMRVHEVCAFAVGIGGDDAARTFRTVRDFAVKRAMPALGFPVDTVWVAPTVAVAAANSPALEALLPGASSAQRVAAALAMALRNPLHAIARLFDARGSARDLAIGCDRYRRACPTMAARLGRWMSWELSLWVASCGVEVNALLREHAPELVLQFVPGLGPRRARQLVSALQREHGSRVASRAQLQNILRDAVLGNGSNGGADLLTPEGAAEAADSQVADMMLRNAIPSVRVVPTHVPEAAAADGSGAHPLDATLVPLEMYQAAAEMVLLPEDASEEDIYTGAAVRGARGAALLASVMTAPIEDRWRRVLAASARNQFRLPMRPEYDFLELLMKPEPSNNYLEVARRVLAHFLVDQIVAGERPTQVRVFRCVNAERYFEIATNLTFTRKDLSAGDSTRQVDPRFLFPNRRVEGTISRCDPRDGGVIVASLSIGVSGTISVRDMDKAPVQQQLLRDWAALAGETRTARGEKPQHPAPFAKGTVVFGRVIAVNYERCELRLSWEAPPEQLRDASASLAGTGVTSSRVSELGTVATEALVRDGRATAYGFVRHPCFMDVSRNLVWKQLSQPHVQLGEVIVRRSHVGGCAFVIAVKVSEDPMMGVMDIACSEIRNSEGRHVYRVENPMLLKDNTKVLFDSVDHIMDRIVNPIMRMVQSIRTHRMFEPSIDDAQRLLSQALHEDTTKLVYRVVQTTLAPMQPLPKQGEAQYAIMCQTKDTDPLFVPLPFCRGGIGYSSPRQRKVIPCRSINRAVEMFKEEHNGQHPPAFDSRHEHPSRRQGSQSGVGSFSHLSGTTHRSSPAISMGV